MEYTIVLTDLVDAPDPEARDRHDRLARDLLPAHRGREYDHTEGFLLLFDAVDDAAAYAIAYHAALRSFSPPLQARVGLHLGSLTLTANPADAIARGAKAVEVDGLAKPTAARVMSLARGGQILMTSEARAALGDTVLRVASHGHWRMKGIEEPVELFEVGDEQASFQPPPDAAKVYRVVRQDDLWIPAREIRHSLPRERDGFVGRRSALLALAGRVDEGASLVSVLGMGGTGKTRLVVHFGWAWLGDWPGGVWFCDLSEARDEGGVISAVAAALGVPLGAEDPTRQIGHTLAARGRCLVLLDNFEQVVRHAAATVGMWRMWSPEACFVVTTREVLGLPGEDVLALAPLDGDDAVALFAARAAQARPGWSMSVSDRGHVDALVALLDGLPLAIELAAARVRVMSPEAIRARMGERFKLLASSGGRHSRQATLRGALDWSWDLLGADEQSALAQLSVFEGGWTAASAAAVLSLAELSPREAVDALVDKSLVRRLGGGRYDLLVSVKVYASEKLETLGGRGVTEQRHGGYFAANGDAQVLMAQSGATGAEQRRALVRDVDNLLVAVRRACARGDGSTAVNALRVVWAAVEMTGHTRVVADLVDTIVTIPALSRGLLGHARLIGGEAQDLLGRKAQAETLCRLALEDFRASADPVMQVRALCTLSTVERERGQLQAAEQASLDALDCARSVNDVGAVASALRHLAMVRRAQMHFDEARVLANEAIEGFRSLGQRVQEGYCQNDIGNMYLHEGLMIEARDHYLAAQRLHEAEGEVRAEGMALGNLGEVLRRLGQNDAANDVLARALVLYRSVGYRRFEGMVLSRLGTVFAALGQTDQALATYAEAAQVLKETGYRVGETWAYVYRGKTLHAVGLLDEAVADFASALTFCRSIGYRPLEGVVLAELGWINLRRGQYDDAEANLHLSEGPLRAEAGPLEVAKMLCVRAQLRSAQGDRRAAGSDLDEACLLAGDLGAMPTTEIGALIHATRAVVEAA